MTEFDIKFRKKSDGMWEAMLLLRPEGFVHRTCGAQKMSTLLKLVDQMVLEELPPDETTPSDLDFTW